MPLEDRGMAHKVLDKALTLLSEGNPSFVCRALSDMSLGVQDFTCQTSVYS